MSEANPGNQKVTPTAYAGFRPSTQPTANILTIPTYRSVDLKRKLLFRGHEECRFFTCHMPVFLSIVLLGSNKFYWKDHHDKTRWR